MLKKLWFVNRLQKVKLYSRQLLYYMLAPIAIIHTSELHMNQFKSSIHNVKSEQEQLWTAV